MGAGLPAQEQNEKYMKKLGTIVYLKGSFKTIWKRIESSYPGENQEDKMKKLLAQRDPVYASFADIIAVTGTQPFEGLVEEIEEQLREKL